MTTDQERAVLDRAKQRAEACRSDAALFLSAADAIRKYAHFGDEFGDATENPEAASCLVAMQAAARIANESSASIERQMRNLPGYEEWRGDPMADLAKSFGLDR